MTTRGPIPKEKEHSDIDYEHYIQKQIRPLAEGLLNLKGTSFDDIMGGDQLTLF